MKSIVVLYHSDCPDGFGGAWAAWRKLGKRAQYLPIKHQAPPPAGLRGKTIYLIDIVYPPEVMAQLKRKNRLVVIDHHKSARESAAIAHEARYDLSHSGATLAWQHFHPGKRAPRLLLHVEDMDLWKFALPGTREIMASAESVPRNFRTWSKLEREVGAVAGRAKHRARGKVILAYQKTLIDQIARSAEEGAFEGHRARIANTPVLDSEVAHALLSREFPVAIIWRRTSGRIRVSLRSLPAVDVSVLAERYGGGGHPQAAGFKLPPDAPLPWRYAGSKLS